MFSVFPGQSRYSFANLNTDLCKLENLKPAFNLNLDSELEGGPLSPSPCVSWIPGSG